MKRTLTALIAAGIATIGAAVTEDWIDELGERLGGSFRQDTLRLQLRGLVDAEAYNFDRPAPAFFATDDDTLFAPRLTLFLDGQQGSSVYFFAQARLDRGFDPGDHDADLRLDEYAVRLAPWKERRLNFQFGKFATVVGNWVTRHDSWTNPFITAPLPYENVTGMFDIVAATSTPQVLRWAHLGPGPFPPEEYQAAVRLPIIWGPSYTTGAAFSGSVGKFDFAGEFKNASLSSRPKEWDAGRRQWQHPTISGRVGWRPNAAWNLGISASSGAYLLDSARTTLPLGASLDDYRQDVIAADLSYAWRHFQLWAEWFQSRFTTATLGAATTRAYYVEARYKFTPRFSAALRWNEQTYGTLPGPTGGRVAWGRDTWRVDVAPTFRLTPHLQFKLQYSWQQHPLGAGQFTHLAGAQLSLRF